MPLIHSCPFLKSWQDLSIFKDHLNVQMSNKWSIYTSGLLDSYESDGSLIGSNYTINGHLWGQIILKGHFWMLFWHMLTHLLSLQVGAKWAINRGQCLCLVNILATGLNEKIVLCLNNWFLCAQVALISCGLRA